MGVGYPGSASYGEEWKGFAKTPDRIKEEPKENNFSMLWYMIRIPKEKQKNIEKNGNSLLVLYYLIKECGADKEWQEDYNYWNPKEKNGELIGHSGYSSYFLFQELKEEIQKMIGVKGTNYSDTLKNLMKDKK